MKALTLQKNADNSWSLIELTLENNEVVDVREHGNASTVAVKFSLLPGLAYDLWHPGGEVSRKARMRDRRDETPEEPTILEAEWIK